jgi:hypothetical protein
MGTHEREGGPRLPPGLLRSGLAAAATLGAVVLIVVLLQSTSGQRTGGTPAVEIPPGIDLTAAVTAPTPTPTATPTATPSPGHPASPGRTRAATTAPATAKPFPTANPAVAVRVLNYSRVKGLARRAAGQLEARGWRVVEFGNSPHRALQSTVYFSPGQAGAAAALRRQFSGVRDVQPAPGDLPGAGLTLVVTRDWPGA